MWLLELYKLYMKVFKGDIRAKYIKTINAVRIVYYIKEFLIIAKDFLSQQGIVVRPLLTAVNTFFNIDAEKIFNKLFKI